MSEFISDYTGRQVNAAVGSFYSEVGFMDVLTLISVASAKGYTPTYSSTDPVKVAIVDDTNAIIAGIGNSLEYVGVDFSDAITFINNLSTNNQSI